jgi:hypothetical protein
VIRLQGARNERGGRERREGMGGEGEGREGMGVGWGGVEGGRGRA